MLIGSLVTTEQALAGLEPNDRVSGTKLFWNFCFINYSVMFVYTIHVMYNKYIHDIGHDNMSYNYDVHARYDVSCNTI